MWDNNKQYALVAHKNNILEEADSSTLNMEARGASEMLFRWIIIA
jgi:hypothetical protein